jgi:GPH family glycoside/pentoside/hexuronide:cation symporter
MTKEKLSLKEKIGYGFGDAASSMFWKLFGMYLMFFYTDVFGITAAVAGTMMLFTRVGDAVIDPLIGIMGDRTNTRWGKFRPYLLWIAVPFGIIGILTFTTPELSLTGKIIYAYVTYSLMMIIYSLINVPYASLMGVMTADGKERTTLATFRFIFAFGGSFLVLGLYQPLFDSFGTKTATKFSSDKFIEVKDSTQQIAGVKTYMWQGESVKQEKPLNDSLVFITAKVVTKSTDAFKIGVYNPKNSTYSWFSFPQGRDTLGLHRNGTTSDVQIKLSSIASKENLASLSDLQLVVSQPETAQVTVSSMTLKEINYRFGIQKAAMVIAVIAVIFFLLTFAWTRERVKPILEKTSLKNDLKDLGKNGPWFILLGAGISTIFFNTIRDGAAIYYFNYYYKGQGSIALGTELVVAISTIYLLLGQAANIVGVVLAKPISDKIGKKNTFLIAMLGATFFSLIFYFLDKTNITMIYTFQVLISICAGTIFPLVWSMYADTADYSEWKNGRRATGLVFSAASMSQKIGASIGMALVGWLLTLYHYNAGVEQAAVTQQGIRMMLSIYPAIGALLAAFFIFIYPLKDSFLSQIESELEVRRKSNEKNI